MLFSPKRVIVATENVVQRVSTGTNGELQRHSLSTEAWVRSLSCAKRGERTDIDKNVILAVEAAVAMNHCWKLQRGQRVELDLVLLCCHYCDLSVNRDFRSHDSNM